jgi:hypothetical protein
MKEAHLDVSYLTVSDPNLMMQATRHGPRFETISSLSVFHHLEKIPEFKMEPLIRPYLTLPLHLIVNNEQSRSISSCGTHEGE